MNEDDSYFIVHSGEDGTVVSGPLTRRQVLARITPDGDGVTDYGKIAGFHDHVPADDKGYWLGGDADKLLIIKGKIVQPKPVKTVTSYELP